MNSLWLKKRTEIFPLCLVFSGFQALQPWNSIWNCEDGKEAFQIQANCASLRETSQPLLVMQGQNILCQGRAKGCSNASSFFWSSRQEERLRFFAYHGCLCLEHRACLWWGRTVSQGWNRVHQGNECSCLSSTIPGHNFLVFLQHYHPFYSIWCAGRKDIGAANTESCIWCNFAKIMVSLVQAQLYKGSLSDAWNIDSLKANRGKWAKSMYSEYLRAIK